ncbi:MAG: single-stranded DNA exonuclease RecJ [Candidatus Nitrosopelagicus sp.]|nr:single-stranded DNA exonuclease RecJ [Candidatus Nitrosopelagicus sp.]MBT5170800.1 single-stranded DNA exonuclease RecJ [Candidatus Nitrosopelagicus sp.]MBT6646578.1 single-stranded DNA exonuclease RecJ [Nitrososphaerota archaeon]MBT7252618.1 single-stranded DNA exonuclease RecJ [Candidatus Nitrosopelagicus sp.]
MVSKIKKSKIVCVSHREDADGISSAALIKQAFGGETILTDYPGMMDDMEPLRSDEELKELYICDLGLNKKNESDFVELLTQLRKRRIKISYIDHHDLDKKIINQLKKIKVNVVHDTNECASVQVYNTYKRKLNDHAAFVAACAAITDYMEDRPFGSKLLQIFDRQFALISATVMTYNIVGHQKEPDYLLYLVDELSESKYPHEIPNSFEFAQLQVAKLASIISKVKENMKLKKNLGYMEITDSGASGAVNFVLGLSGKDVGVAYKERVDYGVYAVSVRGSKQCKIHLGRLINKITTDIGGSGGGHDKACGASIPKDKITKFINTLNSSLAK